jgi:hypothetical protein
MKRLVLLPVVAWLSFLAGCSKKEAPKATAVVSGDADIRSVDFRNFDYPKISGEIDTEIHLRNGIHKNLFRDLDPQSEEDSPSNGAAYLEQVIYNYDDDGKPIAIVVLDVDSGGTMSQSEIFLYGWEEKKPRLIWSFETGDRADGGLRTVYFESGGHNLVMELCQEGANDPLCCARYFARHFYNWRGGMFVKLGSDQWIPLPKQPPRLTSWRDH